MKRISFLVIHLLICGMILPLFANYPTENGCEDKCKCEADNDKKGEAKNDGSPGNPGAAGGVGGGKVDSVFIWINWGAPANENITGNYRFSIYTKKPTPLVYSPQIIQYRNFLLDRIAISEINQQYKQDIRGNRYDSEEITYSDGKVVRIFSDGGGQEKLMTSLASDVTHLIKIFTADREMMIFQFKTGNPVGTMIGETSTMNNRLVMVDSSGNPTTTNPTYYDRYLGYGNFLRYSAETGNVVSYHTATGRIITPNAPTVGIEPIYESDGTIRQVWSLGDGLADVVVTETAVSYEIRCYSPDKVGAKVDGLYTVTGEPHTVWRIENPTPGINTKIKVTKTVGGIAEVSLFEYSHNVQGWLLRKPGTLAIESQSTAWDYSQTVKVITTVEKTPEGQVASKVARTYQKFAFGDRIVNVAVDPEGANLCTTTTYYTDSQNSGSYGRKKTESFFDGYWTSYQYDDYGREVVKITPWKNTVFNSPATYAKALYRSFTPHDSRDIVENDDVRPRTEETKILGITTAKTYYAYYFDENEYVEIEERCTNALADYGDVNNLRTERRYYPKGDCSSPSAGRIHTIKYPNGTMDTYTYEYGTWTPASSSEQSVFVPGNGIAVRVKVTHGTVANPEGIVNKTTQDMTIYDTRGCVVYTTQSVYSATGYEQFSWTSNTYDEQRRQLSEQNSNNELTEYTWNCCAKASETLPDGTQYTYIYDDLRRLISKTKVGFNNQPDKVFTYQYDAANRRTSETISGGNLSTIATWEYNLAGQLIKETNHQGLVTTYAYTKGSNTGTILKGQTIIVTHPGGFTSITENFTDGRKASLTGTAQTAQYFNYGVNTDGSVWFQKNIGGADSVRWEKSTKDLCENDILLEKSGFGGIVSQQNFYNTKNQLIKSVKTGISPILYEYDAVGDLVRKGLDVNESNTLELSSSDRIIDIERSINSLWQITSVKAYPTFDDNIPVTVLTEKVRLSDWDNYTVAEIQQTDISGNVTVRERSINRVAKEVVDKITYPDSTIPERRITINGQLHSICTKSEQMTTWGYDGLGRVISITEPRIGTTTITYHTTTGKAGLYSSITNAAGDITIYDYDPLTGRLVSIKNPLQQYTRYAYNSFGQVTKIWGDSLYPIEIGYDSYGQQIMMRTYRDNVSWSNQEWPVSAVGDLTTWDYDIASGLVVTKTNAANQSVNYMYTTDGKLSRRTWARGIVTNYSYAPTTGELLNIDYGDDTPDITYSYNRLGQVATVQDAAGIRNFLYDNTLNLTRESIVGIYNKELNRTYTSVGVKGRPLGFSIGETQNYSYSYDIYGRLNKIATPQGDFSYTFLPDSDLISQLTRPNEVATTWNYETHRNLVTQVNNGGVSIFNYVNNALGYRISMGRSGDVFTSSDILTYSYNDRNEIVSATSSVNDDYEYSYSYDSIGNRQLATLAGVNWSYTLNALNQYSNLTSSIKNESFAYDFDGNMLNRDGWTQSWNGENRLVEIEKEDVKLQFNYDYMGRRISMKIYKNDNLITYLLFVYDGYKLIEELDALNNNAMLRRYCWQPEELGMDVPLSVYDATMNTTYFYMTDANKNVCDLVDNLGNVVAHYEYSPFGVQTVATGAYAQINPFCFSSEYYNSEINLVYYNFRYYSPELGRWLNQDPIGEQGGINTYNFLENNPIFFWDILGLDKFVYDGNKLCRISDDGKDCKKCWEAISGHADENGNYDFSKERQKVRSEGPIPEGEYLIPSNKTKDPGERGNWDLEDWEYRRKNRWPWQVKLEKRGPVAWGRNFGRLEPKPGTETYGRHSFNIHGGTSKGSAGCIDMGNNEKEFFEELRRDFAKEGEATVIVDYSGASSKACECTEVSPAGWKK